MWRKMYKNLLTSYATLHKEGKFILDSYVIKGL